LSAAEKRSKMRVRPFPLVRPGARRCRAGPWDRRWRVSTPVAGVVAVLI